MPQREVKISIQVNGNDANAAVERLTKRFNELGDASDKAIKNVSKDIAGEVSKSFASGGEREYLETIRRISPELKQLQNNLKNGSFSQEDYNRRLQLLHPITQKAITDANELGRGIKVLGDSTEHTANGFQTMLIKADLVGRGISLLTQTVADGWREYQNYGRELAKVDTILGNNSNVEKFRAGILELDPALGSATELARGLYLALGSDVKEPDALKFLADSAKAAKAGVADVEQTVDAATTIIASYNLQIKDASKVYDQLFEVVNRGKIELPQLAQSIGQVTSVAAISGVTLEELFAAVATATLTNKPAVAIEGLRTALSNIIKPSQDAQELAEQLGLEFSASALKAKGLAQFLQEVSEKTGNSAEKLAVLFGDIQGFNIIATLAGQNADKFAENLKAIGSASGTVDKAFEKQQQSLGVQFDTFINRISKGFVAAFSSAEPIIKGVLSVLNFLLPVIIAVSVATAGLKLAVLLLNTEFFTAAAAALPSAAAALGRLFATMTSLTLATSSLGASLAVAFGWLTVIGVVVGVVYFAFANMETAIDKANKVTLDSINANAQSLASFQSLAVEANNISQAQTQNSDVHERLNAILGRLDPATQIYIKSLKDEKQQVGALTAEIERNIAIQKFNLEAKLRTVADGVIAQRSAIESERQYAETFQKQIQQAQTTIDEIQAKFKDDPLKERILVQSQAYNEARDTISRYSQTISDSSDRTKELSTSLAENDIKLIQLAQGLQLNSDQLREFFTRAGYTKLQIDQLIIGYNQANEAAKNAANGIDQTTGAVKDQTAAVFDLRKELSKLSGGLQQNLDKKTLEIVQNAKDKTEATKLAREALKSDPVLQQSADEIKRLKETQKAVEDVFSPSERSSSGSGSGSGARRTRAVRDTTTAVGQLKQATNELAKAERELNALRAGGGRLFEVKVRREAVDEEKRQLEAILKLRRELGQNDRAVLPNNSVAAKGELEQLERVKRLRDEVLKIQEESANAEDKLLVSRLTANAEIVSAQTRSDQAYFDSIKKKREAEANLTTEIVGEIRRREFAETESVKNSFQAQAEAYKDFIGEQTNRDFDRQKKLAALALKINADAFVNNPLVATANKLASAPKPDVSPVVLRIEKSNDLLGQILTALKPRGGDGASAERFVGGSGSSQLRVTSGNRQYDALYARFGAKYGVDPNVLLEQGRQESINFRKSVISGRQLSPKGAGGIAQFLPDTARRFGLRVGGGVDERFNPEKAIEAQAKYNAVLLDKFNGDYRLALAGYNAGEGRGKFRSPEARLNYFLKNVRETREYVPRILAKAGGGSEINNRIALTQVAPLETQLPDTSKRPRIAGENPIADSFNNVKKSFFGDLKDADISDQSFESLTKYYELIQKFTLKEGETQSIGEREAIGAAKLARQTNVEIDQIKDLTVLQEHLNALKTDDVAKAEVLQNAEIARRQQLISLTSENIFLEEKLRNGGRDRETEAAQLANERLKTLTSVGEAEANLERVRALNADKEVQRARQTASVINERADLENRLATIENERATGGVNQALRVRVGIEEELLNIHKADLDAQIASARAQVQIADSTNLHVEQVRANVLTHLAQQKTLTETIGDEIINLYDKLATASDKFLDQTIGKIPILGGIAKNLARNALTGFTQNLLDKFLPPELSASLQQTGNPVVDKLTESNKYLKQIASGGGDVANIAIQAAKEQGSSGGGIFDFLKKLFGGGSSSAGSSGGSQGGISGLSGVITNLLGGGGGSSPITTTASGFQLLGGTPSFNPGGNGAPNIGNLGKGFNLSSLTGKGGIFGEQGFGNNAGTYGGIGAIANIVGGLIGGRVGGIISGTGSGLAIGATIGSFILPGIGTAIGAAIGAAVGFFASLFGGNKQEKADKKEKIPALNKGFTEALAQLRAISSDRNAILRDPQGAIDKANEIRGQIAGGFGIVFESKKYRNESKKLIAAKLVEADSVIGTISEFAKKAFSAKDLEGRIIPEFATGNFFGRGTDDQLAEMAKLLDNRRGFITGGQVGVDRHLGLFADGEAIINQKQQSRINELAGFNVLAEADIPNYPRTSPTVQRFETGGFFDNNSPSPSVSSPSNSNSSSADKTINMTFNLNQDAQGQWTVQAESDNGYKVISKVVQRGLNDRDVRLPR